MNIDDILVFTIILIVAMLLESAFFKNVYEFTHQWRENSESQCDLSWVTNNKFSRGIRVLF